MKRLLNTLYVTTPDSYLSLDGENIVVLREEQAVLRVPLHNLEAVMAFGFTGASPALMGACAKRDITLCFFTQYGRFLARVSGETRGNVVLRKTQVLQSEDLMASLRYARQIICGKVFNARWVIERATRDHALRLDVEKLKRVSKSLYETLQIVREAGSAQQLRGLEGEAAAQYFSVFDELILQQKQAFHFTVRNRRPALDAVNALLSFVYSLLAAESAAALEAVGLDPYVGFLHRDRPGRASLALDCMEELRPVFADRFVLSLINRKMVTPSGFKTLENGAVVMDDDTRKIVLTEWHNRKQEELEHPFLKEKMKWGLVPHAQALLLARTVRGDLEDYPPFLWK